MRCRDAPALLPPPMPRLVDVLLDDALVFSGEVRQAPGSVREALAHAELVLFTGARALAGPACMHVAAGRPGVGTQQRRTRPPPHRAYPPTPHRG